MKCGNISGVILAGGENRRFDGLIKSKSLIGGKRIIDRMLTVLEKIFDEIIIITNTPDEFSEFRQCIIAGDFIKNAGPLSGIHSAMKNSTKESIFVFAGDMPFLSSKLIIRQTGVFYNNVIDVVVPVLDNDIEPLHGIYSSGLLTALEAHLKETTDYNIRRFLEKTDYRIYRPKPTKEVRMAFTNINSPAESSLYDAFVK